MGFRDEIFSYGMRNPWRISFDKKDLWAADVGQNTLEEIDLIQSGKNYGWSIKEGKNCFRDPSCDDKNITDPIFQYGRELGSSVTGGYVYRNDESPNLYGAYIFGDFVSGRVFALEKIQKKWRGLELKKTKRFISTFGRDSAGRIYMASYADGKIFLIR